MKKFIQLTNTGEQTAICCLSNNDWKLEIACDNYFQNPDIYYRELDKRKVEQLYTRYRDPSDHAKINADGVMKFLQDLGLSPESRLVLIIAWKFRAEAQCEFSHDEFLRGFQELGVDSIEKLKEKLHILDNELADQAKFKDFYQFTFNYAKDPGQKGLDLDMAIAYWRIVLAGRFKFLEDWCRFLTVSPLFFTFLVKNISKIQKIAGKPQTINSKRHLEPTIGLCAPHRRSHDKLRRGRRLARPHR